MQQVETPLMPLPQWDLLWRLPIQREIWAVVILIAKPVAGDALFLDFREVAPASATQGMYLDDRGEIIAGLSTETLLAVGVRARLHGLLRIVEDYGKLSRQQILTPAVRLADEGLWFHAHCITV